MYSVLMVVVATFVSKLPDGNCQDCLCHEVYVIEGLGPQCDKKYTYLHACIGVIQLTYVCKPLST